MHNYIFLEEKQVVDNSQVKGDLNLVFFRQTHNQMTYLER